jgi:eukaryotic-like serine/threonine-protein kinase
LRKLARSAERLLEPAADEPDARAAKRLTEDGAAQLARFADDPLALPVEADAGREQCSARSVRPACELCEAVSRFLLPRSGDPRLAAESRRHVPRLDRKTTRLGPRAHLLCKQVPAARLQPLDPVHRVRAGLAGSFPLPFGLRAPIRRTACPLQSLEALRRRFLLGARDGDTGMEHGFQLLHLGQLDGQRLEEGRQLTSPSADRGTAGVQVRYAGKVDRDPLVAGFELGGNGEQRLCARLGHVLDYRVRGAAAALPVSSSNRFGHRFCIAAASGFLPERYRSTRLLARGGMSDVYLATDALLDRNVAVKVLAERYAQDADIRTRFTREALAAARLSGEPHVVTIYDVGEHEARPFIVMEHLAGGSLRERMRGGPLPIAWSLTWLEQAGGALDAAHRRGVVHRDVKPANLMLDEAEVLHVSDFGIASAAGFDELTAPGTILGTAGYLSPEQARGEPAGPASDRYALAVVAFELLTGARPFAAETSTAEALRHASEPPPRAAELNPRLPRHVDTVLTRALAKAPEHRYETCADFVSDLRAAFSAAEQETVIRGSPAVATSPRRRSAALPLLAAAAALGLGGAGLAFALTRGDGEPRVVTRQFVRTETVQGSPVTVTEATTVTQEPATTATPPSPPAVDGRSAEELNDAGFELMQAGNYAAALSLLEQSVAGLQGSGTTYEAYASYNLAFTRLALGRCDGVLDLVDRSEQVQGERRELDRLRRAAERACEGDSDD